MAVLSTCISRYHASLDTASATAMKWRMELKVLCFWSHRLALSFGTRIYSLTIGRTLSADRFTPTIWTCAQTLTANDTDERWKTLQIGLDCVSSLGLRFARVDSYIRRYGAPFHRILKYKPLPNASYKKIDTLSCFLFYIYRGQNRLGHIVYLTLPLFT